MIYDFCGEQIYAWQINDHRQPLHGLTTNTKKIFFLAHVQKKCTFAAMFRKRQIIGTMYIMMTVIVAGIIAACTPCVVREAQTVVAEADSLRAEGQMYSDSVQLAEACATLGRWLKQHFPDRLRKVYDFAAGESKTRYTAVGDTFMIKYPDRQQVRCHRNLTSEQIQAEVDYYLSLARSGVVLVSPFISPAEKAVYEACYKEKRRMIRLVKRALDGKFVYPQGRDFDACVQGFLLVLSPFPTGNENAAETTITRNQCLSLNDYAADLASSPARRVNDAYHGYISSSPAAPSSSSPAATKKSQSPIYTPPAPSR